VLRAYLCSSLFALSLETNADLGLGAGVLTLGASNLRSLPCIDLEQVARSSEVDAVLSAATSLMSAPPPDVADLRTRDDALALDCALVAALGLAPGKGAEVQEAVVQLASARLEKAKKRNAIRAVGEKADIASVVASISETLERWLRVRPFPEGFCDTSAGRPLSLTDRPLHVTFNPLIGSCDVTVSSSLGVEYEETIGVRTAEVLARSLQMGRRNLALPSTEEEAAKAITALGNFLTELEAVFEQSVSEISLGDRHRGAALHGVLEKVHMPLDALRTPWDRHSLSF
jgi:hypothetical protein